MDKFPRNLGRRSCWREKGQTHDPFYLLSSISCFLLLSLCSGVVSWHAWLRGWFIRVSLNRPNRAPRIAVPVAVCVAAAARGHISCLCAWPAVVLVQCAVGAVRGLGVRCTTEPRLQTLARGHELLVKLRRNDVIFCFELR